MDTRLRELRPAAAAAATKSSDSSFLPYAVRTLHVLYAVLIVWVLQPCTTRFPHDPAVLLALAIGVPLIVDNLRLSMAWGRWASQVSFLTHEALTPCGLFFLPLLFDENLPVAYRRAFWVATAAATAYFTWHGLQRYVGFTGRWREEVSLGGVAVWRPANASHAALVPIFMQVLGVIAGAGAVTWARQLPASHPVAVLFYAQLVVFLGNGAVGPSKVLMGLFGNGLEVLWLWSLVQATLSFY